MADRKVDSRLYLPPLEGYSYTDETLPEPVPSQIELDIPITSTGLQPPSGVRVIEQVHRKGRDGKAVVDLILEVEGPIEATEYEVRTARI